MNVNGKMRPVETTWTFGKYLKKKNRVQTQI
jgi:hypothetical protein